MISKGLVFRVLFNTLLGLALILIWSRFVNIREILDSLSKVNPGYLVPIFLCMLASPVIRAIRLKVFLAEVRKLKMLELIWLNGAALMLNFFIPIRAGEFAKAVYLNTNYKLSLGKSVVWILLDRFIDFLVVLLLAGVLLVLIPTSLHSGIIKIIIVILVLALVLTYLAIFQLSFTKKLITFLRPLFIISSIKIYFERFSHFILEAFSILNRHPKDLGLLFLLTILGYAADAAIWYFTFMALGSYQDFFKMYLGQLLSALTYLIPAAPGYVGSAEASGTLILSGVFGIGLNLASAMLVLFHVLTVVFVLVYGILSVYLLKLNIGAIFTRLLKKDKIKQKPDPA